MITLKFTKIYCLELTGFQLSCQGIKLMSNVQPAYTTDKLTYLMTPYAMPKYLPPIFISVRKYYFIVLFYKYNTVLVYSTEERREYSTA